MRIGQVAVGEGAPLALISGLNVLESEAAALECAKLVREIAEARDFPLIFKASFDKANRSSVRSYRGPGLDRGLAILARVKREVGLPILTDVHEPGQAKLAAEVADCLQVPAFLCRQTDLLLACGATGRAVNIKKGQYMAPHDMRQAVEKVRSAGEGGVLLTERGTSFGYNNLVVDMEGLAVMRAFAPVCFDATHSVQRPAAKHEASGGDRRFIAPLARAAVAVGVDALFVEVHANPDAAPCDGPSQIDFNALDQLLVQVRAIDGVLRAGGGPATG
ncbi:MAG: 3-deoxy-8-phosphooctulonate synthase [Deltaproteobacteria bacterium]|nr:MAG: 3-deoxy-8-phosphooctulonate synthase [Deltaproteobacteria bacterium]